jgi:hypothetical protein
MAGALVGQAFRGAAVSGAQKLPRAEANGMPAEVYIHLLEDEIWHLRKALAELIRLHYGLDDQPKG